jgi:hypothetical protein
MSAQVSRKKPAPRGMAASPRNIIHVAPPFETGAAANRGMNKHRAYPNGARGR